MLKLLAELRKRFGRAEPVRTNITTQNTPNNERQNIPKLLKELRKIAVEQRKHSPRKAKKQREEQTQLIQAKAIAKRKNLLYIC